MGAAGDAPEAQAKDRYRVGVGETMLGGPYQPGRTGFLVIGS